MSNKRSINLTIDIMDLPMVVHAFRIAACTAMMCGHKSAQARFDQYNELLKAHTPKCAEIFNDIEEVFHNIGVALLTCKTWSVTINRKYSWQKSGEIILQIDDKKFKSDYHKDGFSEESKEFSELIEFIDLIAPLDAVRIQPEEQENG